MQHLCKGNFPCPHRLWLSTGLLLLTLLIPSPSARLCLQARINGGGELQRGMGYGAKEQQDGDEGVQRVPSSQAMH